MLLVCAGDINLTKVQIRKTFIKVSHYIIKILIAFHKHDLSKQSPSF